MSANSTKEETTDNNQENFSPTQALQILDPHAKSAVPHYASLIGKGLTLKGNISAKEDLCINGRVEGEIALKKNTLEVGEDARIEANVYARIAVISGELKGDVYASEKACITQTARIFGNIFASDVDIKEGALIKGKIDMNYIEEFQVQASDVVEEQPAKRFGFRFKKAKDKLPLNLESKNATHHSTPHTEEENFPTRTFSDSFPSLADFPGSILGKTIFIQGEIIADEDVFIDGEMDGVIYLKNNNLEVGLNAQLRTNIYVHSIYAQGEIKGDVYASEQATLKEHGHVFGMMRAPRVGIKSGAVLMGSIEMEAQNIEELFSKHTWTLPSRDKVVMKYRVGHDIIESQEQKTISPPELNDSEKAKRVPWPE